MSTEELAPLAQGSRQSHRFRDDSPCHTVDGEAIVDPKTNKASRSVESINGTSTNQT